MMATLRHGAMSTPAGSLMEPQQNMAKHMAGFLEKPAILFTMFFDLGITTLSNIATKLSFWSGAAARGLCSTHSTKKLIRDELGVCEGCQKIKKATWQFHPPARRHVFDTVLNHRWPSAQCHGANMAGNFFELLHCNHNLNNVAPTNILL